MGPWAIRLRPLSDGRVWNGTSPLTGTGDDVVMISPSTANPVSAIVTNSSSQIFTLSASTADEDSLLVNEEGEFNGTVKIPGAAVLISVHTDGTWSVTAR